MPVPLQLVCPRCREALRSEPDARTCPRCGERYRIDAGIADFSGGSYYDRFDGPESLPEESLRGLANECESARIEDFYMPLLRDLALTVGEGGPRPTVLDSGCGNGQAVDLLNASGFDAWGHDLSALRKWQWRERTRKDRLVVADAAALPFPSSSFDFVIASGVLEHVGVAELRNPRYTVRPLPDKFERRRTFLAGLIRVLAPRGTLFLDFPNGAFPIDFWHGEKPGGARFHSRRESFLPTLGEVRALCASIEPALTVAARSPRGRLRFGQVSAHWYGRLFRTPMRAFLAATSLPPLRFFAASPLNPYLVLEARRPSPSPRGRR